MVGKTLKSFQKQETLQTTETVLLLEAVCSEGTASLETINLTTAVHVVNHRMAEVQKRARFAEIFKSEMLTGKQLKKLCIENNLTILKPSQYNGIPDKETDIKIKEVLNKNMHGSSSIENKFLIITENVNHKKLLNNNFTMLLFYENGSPYNDIQINNEDTLVVIHSWGKKDVSLRNKYDSVIHALAVFVVGSLIFRFVDNFYAGIVISFLLMIISIVIKESIDENLEKHLKKVYHEK